MSRSSVRRLLENIPESLRSGSSDEKKPEKKKFNFFMDSEKWFKLFASLSFVHLNDYHQMINLNCFTQKMASVTSVRNQGIKFIYIKATDSYRQQLHKSNRSRNNCNKRISVFRSSLEEDQNFLFHFIWIYRPISCAALNKTKIKLNPKLASIDFLIWSKLLFKKFQFLIDRFLIAQSWEIDYGQSSGQSFFFSILWKSILEESLKLPLWKLIP